MLRSIGRMMMGLAQTIVEAITEDVQWSSDDVEWNSDQVTWTQ